MTNLFVEKYNRKVTLPLKQSVTISKLKRFVYILERCSLFFIIMVAEKNKKQIINKMSRKTAVLVTYLIRHGFSAMLHDPP